MRISANTRKENGNVEKFTTTTTKEADQRKKVQLANKDGFSVVFESKNYFTEFTRCS